MNYKALFIFLNLYLISNIAFAQCEVKKINLGEGVDRYSMSENINEEQDYENGLSSIYLSVNSYGNKADKSKPMVMNMVVTYVWTGSRERFIPNTMILKLASGKHLFFTAEEKSTGTFNTLSKVPSGANSVECIFEISLEDVKLILEQKEVINIKIAHIEKELWADITPPYKSLIPEMFACVIK